jgi:hydrophobic/amphiphilic exporter-1 (mainly G- bacteria), HAE1 family
MSSRRCAASSPGATFRRARRSRSKNAILLVDFANRSRRAGAPLIDALLAAGQVRLRPILMTTAAMIGGMLPLALGLGDGGELQAPMGRAIIGGVITSTLLTLIVVPVIYTYLDGRLQRRMVTRRAAAIPPAPVVRGADD